MMCNDSSLCERSCVKSEFPSIPKLYNSTTICLDNLTALDLSSSSLSKLPEFTGNLRNIVELNLSSNELTTLPLTLNKLQHLTCINLSHNKFAAIPQCLIDGMGHLIMLDLSYNELLNISTKPLCIQHLQSLNISNNLKMNSLPVWLWSVECTSLESLDISFTHCLDNIKADPYSNMYGIGRHLIYLNVSCTNADVNKLGFVKHLKNIRSLVLDNKDTILKQQHDLHNYFNKVPLVFNYRFKFIDSLSMTNVNLSSIGKHMYFSLPNLRVLNLSNNSIVVLPDSLSQLTYLEVCDFSNNQILIVPESFRNLKNLKTLVFNNNWLSSFPNILTDLLKLEFLDLYANKLCAFPLWKTDCSIKSMDLEQNLFSTDNNPEINYSKMLKNLRLSINESRNLGPLYDEDCIDLESSNGSVGSSTHFDTSSSENSIHGENKEDTNFELEEFWECNSYEHTTDLFDPKEFEKSLFAELIKLDSLTVEERTKEKKIFSNVVHLANEHYFCPNDELPKTLSSI